MSSSHSNAVEDLGLLRCDAVLLFPQVHRMIREAFSAPLSHCRQQHRIPSICQETTAQQNSVTSQSILINRLTPNDPYMGRTTPLTSKRCILCIYSTNIGTEYFKHALYSPFFFSSKCILFNNANLFGSCIIHILYTGCAKIKKIIPAPKG